MKDIPPKPFVERLRDRAARSKGGTGGRNRAKFLAVKSDVTDALGEGWPVTQIWEALVEEGRIDFSYQWFAKYVRDLIRAPGIVAAPVAAPIAPIVETPPSAETASDPVEPAAPEPAPRPKPSRFSHPDSPKKEDYL